MLFVLVSVASLAQTSIAGYEYWLDSDYGGRQSGTNSSENISLSIGISDFGSGIHYLNFRGRNSEGEWSTISRHLFFVPPEEGGEAARYESWLDGNYAQRTTTGHAGESIAQSIDISQLQAGIHYYNVRSQNATGQWSTICRYLFFVPPKEGGEAARYESWIDGNYAQRTTIGHAGESIAQSIDISQLQAGIHYYNVRSQNATGQWSTICRYLFYVAEQELGGQLAAVSYWFDNETDIHTQQAEGSTVVVCADISHLEYGQHTFHCRLKNGEGNMTDVYSYAFDYESNVMAQPLITHEGNRIIISKTDSGADIYYTLDGTTPSEKNGTLYTEPFTVTCNGIIRAVCIKAGYVDSPVAELTVDWFRVTNPTFAQTGRLLTISTTTEGATLYYAIGEDETDFTEYGGPLTLTDQRPVRAFGRKEGYHDSETLLFIPAEMQFVVSTPVIIHEGNTVSITVEPDADNSELPTIYYTLDGTTPSKTNGTRYDGPFVVVRNGTIKAIGTQSGYTDSPIAELVIDWFRVVNPTFAQTGRLLTISTTTEGATLYYGIGETATPETLYTGPLTLADEQPVTAVARREGYADSEVVTYTPATTRTPTPLISCNGRYLQLSCPMADAAIHYTLDGTNPTEQAAHYDGEVEIDEWCTVKAVAVADGWNVSTVAERDIDCLFDGVTARVRAGGTLAGAFEWCGGIAGADRLAAIVWEADHPLTEAELADVSNPNLLLYVNDHTLAPASVQNVVVDGVAEQIVLTDVTTGNSDFYCPRAFTAHNVSYTHEFTMRTEPGVSRGWETVGLPFTVERVEHEQHGLLTPFTDSADQTGLPFWLAEMTSTGFEDTQDIMFDTPYIISMPNNPAIYAMEYNQAGRVTFSATNAVIPVTDTKGVTESQTDGSVTFVPTFRRVEKGAEVFAVNVGEAYGSYPEGSVFVANYREVRPFEAYILYDGTSSARNYIAISDLLDNLSGIGYHSTSYDGQDVRVYTLSGTLIGKGLWCELKKRLPRGIYIINGQKIVR